MPDPAPFLSPEIEAFLEEREAQYRSIFEATSDGIYIYDLAEDTILEVNPAFCAMHGYTRSEVVGQRLHILVHPSSYASIRQAQQLLEQGKEFRGRGVHVRKDGSTFPVEILSRNFTYLGQSAVLIVLRDITEQVEAYRLLEERIAERTWQLSTFLEVSRNVASTLDLKPLLNLILDQLKGIVDYDGASVVTFEGDKGVILEYRRYNHPTPEVVLPYRFNVKRGQEVWESLTRNEPLIIGDVYKDPPLAWIFQDPAGALDLARLFEFVRACVIVPLQVKGRLIGSLNIGHSQPDYYTSQHTTLATALANQAALAIENARLYQQAHQFAIVEERQRLARELHDSVSQALYGIGLGLSTARQLLETDPLRAIQPLEYALALTKGGMAEMRALLFELRPESLESEGLVVALSKQAAALRARYELAVVEQLGQEPELSLEIKQTLYQIAREALHNIVKHSRASQVNLELTTDEHETVLRIADNGQGFDPNQAFPGHLGLKSMRERARHIGSSFKVESRLGLGTRIEIRLRPLNQAGYF